jgi:hypothetical protein
LTTKLTQPFSASGSQTAVTTRQNASPAPPGRKISSKSARLCLCEFAPSRPSSPGSRRQNGPDTNRAQRLYGVVTQRKGGICYVPVSVVKDLPAAALCFGRRRGGSWIPILWGRQCSLPPRDRRACLPTRVVGKQKTRRRAPGCAPRFVGAQREARASPQLVSFRVPCRIGKPPFLLTTPYPTRSVPV